MDRIPRCIIKPTARFRIVCFMFKNGIKDFQGSPWLGGSPRAGVGNSVALTMPSWCNQNQSIEVHNILSKWGLSTHSFRTGTHMKLPGPAPDKPMIPNLHVARYTVLFSGETKNSIHRMAFGICWTEIKESSFDQKGSRTARTCWT